MALFLITGATGHLGLNIVYQLCRSNHDIHAFVLPNDPFKHKLPATVKITEGNVTKKSHLHYFFNIDHIQEATIIHCAGIVSTYSRYDALTYEVNAIGTQNIIDLSLEYHVKKLIYVSSVHALKELKKGEMISEIDVVIPKMIIGYYGKSKADATMRVLKAVKDHHLNASIVFPSGIIGIHDYAIGHTTKLIIDTCNRKMNIWMRGGFDFVDVKDVAQGIIQCAALGQPGEGYMLSNRYVSFKELCKIIDRKMNHRLWRPFIPLILIQIFLPCMNIVDHIMKRKPLLTPYALYTIHSNSSFSKEKSMKMLGYKTQDFKKTMDDMVDWLIKEGFVTKKISTPNQHIDKK